MPAASDPKTGLQAGALVAGIYHVEQKVGEGASGEVWSAINTQTDPRCPEGALLVDAAPTRRSSRASAARPSFSARAKSDYVAKIYEFINDPATGMVLVMEFIEGESLAQVFDHRILSVEEAIEVGIDVLSGVVDLPRGADHPPRSEAREPPDAAAARRAPARGHLRLQPEPARQAPPSRLVRGRRR